MLCQTVQVILYALPDECPKCHAKLAPTHWRRVEGDEPPAVPYTVTHNDCRLLHSLHIDPEDA